MGQGLAAAYRAGIVTRAELFLQTKYTYQPGQDHRLPYDPDADLATQVAQSMASSLEHLDTDHVDSYVLHGPASGHGWTEYDAEVWGAMARERDAGRTRLLGVSNVSLRHLQQMVATGAEIPAFVQNRCFAVARLGSRRAGLLRAAPDRLPGLLAAHRQPGRAASPAGDRHRRPRSQATPAQVVFRFALAVGMLPLTGTSSPEHMKQDLAARALALSADEVRAIESLAGLGDGTRAPHDRADAVSHAVLRAAARRRRARAFPRRGPRRSRASPRRPSARARCPPCSTATSRSAWAA